jgi:hypothetical protein
MSHKKIILILPDKFLMQVALVVVGNILVDILVVMVC